MSLQISNFARTAALPTNQNPQKQNLAFGLSPRIGKSFKPADFEKDVQPSFLMKKDSLITKIFNFILYGGK